MKFSYALVILSAIIILVSCKKNVVDISPEYEGEWHSEPFTAPSGIEREMYFIIDGNQGVYGLWCELAPLGQNCTNTFSGDVKFNSKKSKIYIGPLNDQVVLRIDAPAHINADGEWECTITSHVYIRN